MNCVVFEYIGRYGKYINYNKNFSLVMNMINSSSFKGL